MSVKIQKKVNMYTDMCVCTDFKLNEYLKKTQLYFQKDFLPLTRMVVCLFYTKLCL